MNYITRIVDSEMELKLEAFGAVLIEGPKGCGKTTTAKRFSRSFIELQDEEKRDGYLSVANTVPSKLLEGENPRLIDEWQDAPKIWGAVRKSVDDRQQKGLYILTGSTSKNVETPHTGTMRISNLFMRPMSLFELGKSNGEVSIRELFENPNSYDGCHSNLSIDELIECICVGGWPSAIGLKSKKARLEVAKQYFLDICRRDISSIDGQKRNAKWCGAILKTYSRNICTLCKSTTMLADISESYEISSPTFTDYVGALEKLFIIEDIDAWNPSIRSKTAIRSGKKRNLIDPSIATAALNVDPEYFDTDFETLGFFFESLCIRDLRVYSKEGAVSYYHDRYGLEADVVLHVGGDKYALIELKLGENKVDEGAKNLLKIEKLIIEHNEQEKGKNKGRPHLIPLPVFKAVITGTEYGYRRDDGVLVIPIGCLRD